MFKRFRSVTDIWKITIINEDLSITGPFLAKAKNRAGEEYLGSGISREEAIADVTQKLKAIYGKDIKISRSQSF